MGEHYAPVRPEGEAAPVAPAGVLDVTGHVADAELLATALAHRSYVAEVDGVSSNERLEFLGDAVLSLVVAEELYRSHPDLSEGDLTRIRAAVVSTAALAPAAEALGIGEMVHLGRGEEISGGRAKPSILADTFEALIGATFLEGGLDAARRLVLSTLGPAISVKAERRELGDPKNRLQELVSRLGESGPHYSGSGTGPDHARWWRAEVLVGSRVLGTGEGASRKQAERVAAEEACAALAGRAGDAEPARSGTGA